MVIFSWVYFIYFLWESGPQAQSYKYEDDLDSPWCYNHRWDPPYQVYMVWDGTQGFKFARQALYQLTELSPQPSFFFILFLPLFLNIAVYMNEFKQIYVLRIIQSFGSQKKWNSFLCDATEYIPFVLIKIFESKKVQIQKYLGKTEAQFLTMSYFKLYTWRLGINGRKQLICSSATALGQWWEHSLASYQLINIACLFPSWINLTLHAASVSPVLSCLQSNNQTQVFDTLWFTGYLSADRHVH